MPGRFLKNVKYAQAWLTITYWSWCLFAMIEELREDPAPFKKLKEMLDLEGVIVYTQLDGYRCFLPQN